MTERAYGAATPIRVAMLGCGTVGAQVVRLLREQADDLAARAGAPVELVGVAVRRPHRHPELGDLLDLIDRAEENTIEYAHPPIFLARISLELRLVIPVVNSTLHSD